MPLWIRTQDRTGLVETQYVRLSTTATNDCDIYTVSENYNAVLLGTYPSKEKALKVLTIIHARINKLNNPRSNANAVFAMPEYDDVKEEGCE